MPDVYREVFKTVHVHRCNKYQSHIPYLHQSGRLLITDGTLIKGGLYVFKRCFLLLLSGLILLTGISVCSEAALVDNFNKAIAIEDHLQGHELDPIEGIWIWRESRYGGLMFEIAIVPNTFDYPKYEKFDFIGITVDSTGLVKRGATKLLVKKTGENVYEGQNVVIFKDAISRAVRTFEISFSLRNEGTAFSFPVPPIGIFDSEWEVQAEKIWPEDSGVKGDKPGQGTAFFVDKDILVTNEHVVKGFESGKIAYKNKTYTVDVIARDEANDLALLKVNFNDFAAYNSVEPVKVGDVYGVEAGETVFSIGYPMVSDLGVNPKISMGIINGITGVKDDPRMFQVSVPLQPGNSGGPLFDENGGVIGVTTSGLNVAYYMKVQDFSPQNVNFAIKADYINNLLLVTEGCNEMRQNTDAQIYNAKEIMATWRDSVVLVICE